MNILKQIHTRLVLATTQTFVSYVTHNILRTHTYKHTHHVRHQYEYREHTYTYYTHIVEETFGIGGEGSEDANAALRKQ